MTRLHVVGCHRSGTTLLHALLATGFAVDGACEHELPAWEGPLGVAEGVFVSKNPRDVRLLEPLLRADPGLHAIYLVRDPRSVVASRDPRAPERYFVHLGAWLECERHAARLEGHPRFHTLRYEDLVRDPDRAQRELARVFPFLVPRRPFSAFERFARPSGDAEIALGGLRPVAADRIDRWREHLPRVRAQLEDYRGADGGLVAALIRRGYEEDDAWTRALDGVAPERGASRTSEREGLWKRLDRRVRDWRRVRSWTRALATREEERT